MAGHCGPCPLVGVSVSLSGISVQAGGVAEVEAAGGVECVFGGAAPMMRVGGHGFSSRRGGVVDCVARLVGVTGIAGGHRRGLGRGVSGRTRRDSNVTLYSMEAVDRAAALAEVAATGSPPRACTRRPSSAKGRSVWMRTAWARCSGTCSTRRSGTPSIVAADPVMCAIVNARGTFRVLATQSGARTTALARIVALVQPA